MLNDEFLPAIQHAFSKPSLINFISKDVNLVIYLSVYPFVHLQTSNHDIIIDFFTSIQHHWRHLMSDMSHQHAKDNFSEIETVYQAKVQ